MSVYGEELGDALFGAAVGVGEVVADFDFTGYDFEVGDLSDVWLDGGLEEEEAGGREAHSLAADGGEVRDRRGDPGVLDSTLSTMSQVSMSSIS